MAPVKRLSIFKKTSLLAVVLFGVISILTSALAAFTLYDHMTKEYVSKGTAIADSIAGASQEILLNNDVARVQAMIDQYLDIEGVAYVFVVDGSEDVVSHTFVPAMPVELVDLVSFKEDMQITELELSASGRVIDICKPVLAGVAGIVHVGMDKELIMKYFWSAVVRMQVLLLCILMVCVGVLYFVTGRISKPLEQLTDYAERIASHDFSAQLHVTSHDEIGALGRTMKSMADELSTLFSEMESEVERATGDLREHMVYLSSIIENLADGLLVVSTDGTITTINPVIREMFDLSDDDYASQPTSDVFPPEVVALAKSITACDAKVRSAEIPLSRSRVGKAVGSPISVYEPKHFCLGGVILIRDITREKELDQLKTDFISTVSHELRTPMTSVLGFSKIIKKKLDRAVFPALSGSPELNKPVKQVRENVGIIVSEAERLTALINDVLDIAKMEAGEVQWRDQVIFIADVIRQSVDSTRGLWKRKDVEVVSEIDEGVLPVRGDRSRLVQVMVNLISNAVKFTEESPVVCRVVMDGPNVLVSVSDKGVGIPKKAIVEIFDKFKQVGDTLTEKPTGTGLGLPISKQIIDHHHGEIWVESEVGQGSVFYFSLPAVQLQTAEKEDTSECKDILPKPESTMLVSQTVEPRDNPLILVVDDDPTLTKYLSEVFESEEFLVEVAMNGEEAVTIASERLPNLIIMDLMMPGMDGRTAIKCLRNNPFTRNIPIMVLSALADGIAAGGDIALTKPVDDVRIREVARSLLLEKDVRRSCVVLGKSEDFDLKELSAISPENVTFCSPDDLWRHVEEGFKGTIFIPAELERTINVELMTKLPNVAVVILPTLDGQGKAI